uniref:Methyltransferase n=1 Tax=Oryza meridionalis TaxID=40149 RepID=A0A0E0F4W4_9ORYZ
MSLIESHGNQNHMNLREGREKERRCTETFKGIQIEVNKYYDLATSFYEYVWGESLHFGTRWHGETLRESLKRREHFLALQLGLKKGMKVLDVGCGIGGPLREIARFSSASVTGLNNNDYQISRGQELNFSVGLSETCNYVKGDFMNMPIPDCTFDAAYALDATCHAPDAVGVYSEIFRVLKPGRLFAMDEWCLTDKYDPDNARHLSIKAELELGNGLPDIRTTRQCIQALKDAGFEVISVKDMAEESPLPWYQPLDPSQLSLTHFQFTRIGRFLGQTLVSKQFIIQTEATEFLACTWERLYSTIDFFLPAKNPQLKSLEFLHLAPEGSLRICRFLATSVDSLVKGGKEGIFTPLFFVLARKPLQKQEEQI